MENYFAAAVIFGTFVLTAFVSAERKDVPKGLAGQPIDCDG
jgi:hypothetical protein